MLHEIPFLLDFSLITEKCLLDMKRNNLEQCGRIRAQSNKMWQNTRLVFCIEYKHNLTECATIKNGIISNQNLTKLKHA